MHGCTKRANSNPPTDMIRSFSAVKHDVTHCLSLGYPMLSSKIIGLKTGSQPVELMPWLIQWNALFISSLTKAVKKERRKEIKLSLRLPTKTVCLMLSPMLHLNPIIFVLTLQSTLQSREIYCMNSLHTENLFNHSIHRI